MKISVTCMSKGTDHKTTFLAGLIYKFKIRSDLCNRNDYITLIKELSLFHDHFQESRAGCPGVTHFGRTVSNQNVHGTGVKDQFSCLFKKCI